VSQRCTVLIAGVDLLPALEARTAADADKVLAFTDADALRALDAITEHRPSLVALEQKFAATPRGAALINRIKADPLLVDTSIRVVSASDETVLRPEPAPTSSVAAAPTPRAPLDHGTRRAARVAMASGTDILVDGNPAALVDLSAVGAQVLSPTILKPNQRVRVTFSDEDGTWRANGTIAWAEFEIPPRYRAGIEFADADRAALEAYARRHQTADAVS
jgi:hypothetical protein